MIGSIIGGVASLAGSIFGGIKASQAMKEAKQRVADQKAKNQAWYDRRYNEDATQRVDAQALLNHTREQIAKRNREAGATAAVMGGTEASLAATKAANARALADTVTGVAEKAEARKDRVEEQYQARDAALDTQLNTYSANQAAAIGQATQGFGQAMGNMGVAIDDYRDNRAKV